MKYKLIKDAPIHYRYVDVHDEEHRMELYRTTELRLDKWLVVRETPCTYLVVPEWAVMPDGSVHGMKPKRVMKQASRAHCYPCKDLAFRSFKIRKEWQALHSERNLSRAKRALKLEQDSAKPVVPMKALCPFDQLKESK